MYYTEVRSKDRFVLSRARRLAVAVTILTLAQSTWAAEAQGDPKSLFKFGVEMARKGNWREAKYRWEKALALLPGDVKLLNNLGVASEALGDADAASARYAEALRGTPGDPVTQQNRDRLERFRAAAALDRNPDGKADAEALPPLEIDEKAKKKGKTLRVMVHLPVASRLDLTNVKTVLVASFLTPDNPMVDTNREVVRFLRTELKKHTQLQVLDVTPPPAVPEQSIDDLAANSSFFRHLAQEHRADLIISGLVRFSKVDASGFRDVDVVSTVTGQKVRETRFVEQEQFQGDAVVLFLDGATGNLLLRDRLRRNVDYTGLANDPLTAFFDVVQAASPDFLASVAPGTRDEPRFIYKK